MLRQFAVLLMVLVPALAIGAQTSRHGLHVKVLVRSDPSAEFEVVGTLNDRLRSLRVAHRGPDGRSATVFVLKVVAVAKCEADLAIDPASAVRQLAIPLPARVSPGSVVEFQTLIGWDEREYYRVEVGASQRCKASPPRT
jgi:hypothetical protein